MKWLIVFCVSLACVLVSEAAPVAAWDMNGVDLDDGSHVSPYVIDANQITSHVAVAQISLSTNVNPTMTVNQYGFKISGVDEQTTLAGAILAGHYIEITLTASSTHRLNLTSLEMNGQASATGCDDFAVLSSVDGFTDSAVIASVTGKAGVTGGFDTDGSGFGAPIDLSAPKYSGLPSITIRLYGWNSTGGSGVTYIRALVGNDLIVNGTVEELPSGTIMMLR